MVTKVSCISPGDGCWLNRSGSDVLIESGKMRAVKRPLEFANALPTFLSRPYRPHGRQPSRRRESARSRYARCCDVLPVEGGAGLNISDSRKRNGIVNLAQDWLAEVGWAE